MGDVYRLVHFIDTFCQNVTYRTVSDGRAQSIVWRQPRDAVIDRRLEDIARLPYEHVAIDRTAYHFEPLEKILQLLRSRAARGREA
jgi:hypothetical protein